MTSKTTKFYSTAIAAALVATAVVPAASAADPVTAIKVSEDGVYKISLTELTEGDIVKIYESDTADAIATSGAAVDGTPLEVQFNVESGKTYSYKVTTGDTESAAVTITIPTEAPAAPTAPTVTVEATDSAAAGKDTIKVTGAKAGDIVTFYSDEAGATEFANVTVPKGKTEATIKLDAKKDLNSLRVAGTPEAGKEGKLYFKVKSGETESAIGNVEFKLAPISEALNADRIYSVNNVGEKAKDTVTISGVKAKDTVKFYKAEDLEAGELKASATPVQIQKVSKSGAVTVTFKEAFAKDQKFAVTVTSDGQYESAPIEITTAEETKTDKFGTVTSENLLGKKDTVKVTGIAIGATVTVYAKDKATVLGTAKAGKTGEAIVKLKDGFTADHVGTENVYYTVTNALSLATEAKAVEVKAEPVTGFDAQLKTEPAEETEKSPEDLATEALIEADTRLNAVNEEDYTAESWVVYLEEVGNLPEVGADADTDTKLARVDAINTLFSSVLVEKTPTQSVEDVTALISINNLGGTTKDTIEVVESKLPAGAVVNVYKKADITDTNGVFTVTASKKPIATGKTDATGKASIKIKGGLEAYETDGVYMSAVEKGKAESVVKPIAVASADSSVALDGKVTPTNAVGTKADVITVAGAGLLKKGDVINVYAEADVTGGKVADGKKPLVTVKVAKDGADAVAKIKAGFTTEKAAASEKYYVTLQQVDKKETAPLEISVDIEKTSTVTVADVTFTNNIDLKDTVTFKGLGAKDIVEVFEKETDTKAIAKATAKTSGELVVTLKDDFKAGDKVYVKITKFNEHASAATAIDVKAIEKKTEKTLIKTNFITVDDNGTKDATVTVADAQAGVTYTVYDGEGTDAKVLGTAKASKNGILVVKLAKGTTKDKPVSITAREYAKDESEKVKIAGTASTPDPVDPDAQG
ncbi:MAG: hypothetical protein UHX00_15975 [Caryophanon sp.]|nr:hypothetical protein [Caryophanon sp.]